MTDHITKINLLAQNIINEASNGHLELERIKLTLINIRISVAKINHPEAKALDVIADYIQNAIEGIDKSANKVVKLSQEIDSISTEVLSNT